jgi:hypothetical protein
MKTIIDVVTTARVIADAGELTCPRCHTRVSVFDRFEDDHTHRDNPSARRGGIVVSFSCEDCGGGKHDDDVIELIIGQSKGMTEIGWRYTDVAPVDDHSGMGALDERHHEPNQ